MWPPTQGGSGTDGESRKREVVKCGKCGARGEGVIIIFDAGTKMANVPYNCGISHSLLLIVRPLRWIGQRFYVWDERLREEMHLLEINVFTLGFKCEPGDNESTSYVKMTILVSIWNSSALKKSFMSILCCQKALQNKNGVRKNDWTLRQYVNVVWM